jgi:hypothetical protein
VARPEPTFPIYAIRHVPQRRQGDSGEERIKESDKVRPGVIADFGYDRGIVRFEILDASKVVHNTREILFAVNA